LTEYGGFFPKEERSRGCDVCPLRGKVIVPSYGPGNAEILVYGEAPGKVEEELKQPFRGKAGQHLRKTLKQLEIPRETLRIGNVVRCRPTHGDRNRTPKEKEIWACSPFWEEEINQVNPKVILTLGGIPTRAILGSSYDGIAMGDLRMGRYQYRESGIWVVPTWHPSYLIRMEQSRPRAFEWYQQEFEEDLMLAVELTMERPPEIGPVVIANDPRRSIAMLRRVAKQEYTAIDLEFNGDHLYSVGFSLEDGEAAVVVMLDHPESGNIIDGKLHPRITRQVKTILEGDRPLLLGQNFYDSDVPRLKSYFDSRVRGVAWDSMYGSYVHNHKKRIHRLEMIAARFAQMGGYAWEIDDYLKRWELTKGELARVPYRLVGRYNGLDCIATHISAFEEKKSLGPRRRRLARALTRASAAIAEMRHTGIKFDLEYSKNLERQYKKKLAEIEQRLKRIVGDRKFKVSKDQEVGKIIYERYKLHLKVKNPIPEHELKTASGQWSTADEGPLKIIRKEIKHDFVEGLFEWRDFDKDHSTYIVGLQEIVAPDHRVRVPIFLHGTDTGRCSCRLHNVKNFSAMGRYIDEKHAPILWNQFVAEEGHMFVKGDYSQIELRMMAEMSQDPVLIEVYGSGGDLHEETRTWVYGKPSRNKDIAKEQRKISKNVNFGMCFGLDEDALYDYLMVKVPECGLTRAQARKFHRAFFDRASRLREWQEETKAFAHENGYVVGHFGRRRYLDMSQGKHAENQAINSPIQGSAHDVLIAAMIKMYNLRKRDFKIVLDHHDALICEVPIDTQHSNLTRIHKCMVDPDLKRTYGVEMTVPIKVDLEIGDRLGNLTEVPF
jgi:uracil-DNA glycosylase family 4